MSDIAQHHDIAFAFATPIGQHRVRGAEAVNRELKRLILDKEATEPSEPYSNVGGWHSRQDLLSWTSPAIETLRGWLGEAVNHTVGATMEMVRRQLGRQPVPGRVHLRAWANVCRATNYHRVHNHPGSAWSGVYYVDVGEPAAGHPLSGVLELLDPRPHAEMVATPGEPFGQKIIIRPEAGMIVLFPSWLYHCVNPYHGIGERVTVAFNVMWQESAPAAAPNKSA